MIVGSLAYTIAGRRAILDQGLAPSRKSRITFSRQLSTEPFPLAGNEDWRAIVASSLNWEAGARDAGECAQGTAARACAAKRPTGFPHSVWELVEHIRITQHDLLDFVQNPDYEGDSSNG